MLGRNAVKAAKMTLRLTPKILNTIDVIATIGKIIAVIDAAMFKLRHIQRTIRMMRISIHNTLWLDALADNRQQSRAE